LLPIASVGLPFDGYEPCCDIGSLFYCFGVSLVILDIMSERPSCQKRATPARQYAEENGNEKQGRPQKRKRPPAILHLLSITGIITGILQFRTGMSMNEGRGKVKISELVTEASESMTRENQPSSQCGL
jgi:hypothetical protein